MQILKQSSFVRTRICKKPVNWAGKQEHTSDSPRQRIHKHKPQRPEAPLRFRPWLPLCPVLKYTTVCSSRSGKTSTKQIRKYFVLRIAISAQVALSKTRERLIPGPKYKGHWEAEGTGLLQWVNWALRRSGNRSVLGERGGEKLGLKEGLGQKRGWGKWAPPSAAEFQVSDRFSVSLGDRWASSWGLLEGRGAGRRSWVGLGGELLGVLATPNSGKWQGV